MHTLVEMFTILSWILLGLLSIKLVFFIVLSALHFVKSGGGA